MPSTRSRERIILVFVLVICAVLAGCNGLRIGEPYSADIEKALNTYQLAAMKFLKQMEQERSTSKSLYTSDISKVFYAASEADLRNMQLKADLLSSRQCPANRAATLLLAMGLSSDSLTVVAGPQLDGDSDASPAADITGNCIAVTIAGLRMAHADMEALHKENQRLGPYGIAINRVAIESAVRVAVTAVQARNLGD